jgi:HEAT repeat protein
MRTKLIGSLVIGMVPCLLQAAGPFDKVIDSPMYRQPELPVPRVEIIFPQGAKALWLRALERPETDLRCQAAHAIAVAHRDGVKGFETTIDPLLAVIDQPDQHPAVRLAVAEALIALEAKKTAPSLFRHAQAGDGDLRERIEPALARWDYRPARAVWLERLRAPATPRRSLILAMRSLAVVGEEQAAGRLRELALAERTPGPIRLEAAHALASLRPSGLEKDAERLMADTSRRGFVSRLTAASLLRQHRGADAVKLLQRLTLDSEPTVAVLAVARLIEIDPELVVPALKHLLASPDANLRSFAVEVLHRRPTKPHVRLLCDRLDDAHAEVRQKARRYLRELAGEKAWREQILTDATAMLKTEEWRGLEQATILLTQLDHKPAATLLVELLKFDRPEVALTAAWGLRMLAVPGTLPGVVSFMEGSVKRIRTFKGPLDQQQALSHGIGDHVLSQLNQFLGAQKYRSADALLRQFIPKRTPAGMGPESRAAAIWALGMIHQGQPVDALVKDLEERLNDVTSIPPEDDRVRAMSAIALGRMKAENAVPSLRKYFSNREANGETVHNSCGWAIEQITREVMLPPKTIRKAQHDWFLIPRQ